MKNITLSIALYSLIICIPTLYAVDISNNVSRLQANPSQDVPNAPVGNEQKGFVGKILSDIFTGGVIDSEYLMPVANTVNNSLNNILKWNGAGRFITSPISANGSQVSIGGDLDISGNATIGSLSVSSFSAGSITDSNNGNYYLDPNGNSRTNYTNANRVDVNDLRASIMYDRDNTSYYLNPNANTSLYRAYVTDLRASIMYDRDNTGYYVNPASTSRMNYTVFDRVHSYTGFKGGNCRLYFQFFSRYGYAPLASIALNGGNTSWGDSRMFSSADRLCNGGNGCGIRMHVANCN